MTDADFAPDSTPPAPAPAPLARVLPLEPGGAWITEADAEEERTVTVVFQRAPEDEVQTGEFLLRPLAPLLRGA